MLQKYRKLYLSTPCKCRVFSGRTPPIGSWILFLLFNEGHLYFPQYFSRVILIVEISYEIFALLIGDLPIDFFGKHVVDFVGIFVGHFGFDVHFEEVVDSGFEFGLNESKFLVYFIPQYFPKHRNVVVF